MRGIEIEVPDQSDALPPSILKEQAKKNIPSVQSIIDSMPPPSSNYCLISIPFRKPQPDETLRLINQTPFSLFSLFFSFEMLEIIVKRGSRGWCIRDDLKERRPAESKQGTTRENNKQNVGGDDSATLTLSLGHEY